MEISWNGLVAQALGKSSVSDPQKPNADLDPGFYLTADLDPDSGP